MGKQTDIIINGAGIAGLTTALLLAKEDIATILIDPNTPTPIKKYKPTGRTAALWAGSIDLIKQTDVWDTILPYITPIKTLKIIDKDTETAFESMEINRDQFGYNTPNEILRSTLYAKAKKSKYIKLVTQSFESLNHHPAHIEITTDKGKTFQSKLLIAADGRNSPVRNASNIKTKEKDYNQHALTFIINHSRAHNNISTEFHKPGGPLALVPMQGNQSAIVWVEPTDRADRLIALSKQDLTNALTTIIGETLGGITLENGPQSWPLKSITAKYLTAPRTALIAEAAHVMPPISAQGLNLSLRDVRDLVTIITKHKNLGLDIGSQTLLKDYARKRRPDIATRTKGVSLFNQLVKDNNTILQSLRRKGLNSLNHIEPLRKKLMKTGLQ